MDTLAGLLITGATLEAVVQLLRAIWDAGQRNFNTTMIAVLVLSLVFAILGEQDVVSHLWDGLPDIVNQIITGLLFARAAQFVHDVYKKAA